MRPLKPVALAWMSALVFSACGGQDAPQSGVLVVPFELGNGRTCEDLGVVAIRAELDGGDFVEEADCEAGQVRFDHLMPGRYAVVLYGLDDDNVEVMDTLVSGPQPIQVVGNDTTVVYDPPLSLTSAPAKLELRWSFGFSSCGGASIEGFAIAAWRADGSALLMESDLPCDLAGDGRGQYRLVPDLDRELSGDEVGEVEVQPHDSEGFPVGESTTFVFESPGRGQRIQLSLECTEAGCAGTGVPD